MSNRFAFGKNWLSFSKTIDDDRIGEAVRSLEEWLGTNDLSGKKFLDIGSGSGVFSLAARQMGAEVFSFDYDSDSVESTRALKDRYYPNDSKWVIEQGDALDEEYLSKYKYQDIVYSWGVLHHTGNMYKALSNAGNLVGDGGLLFIAIYNDQGGMSDFWKKEKRLYNASPKGIKLFIATLFFVVLWTVRFIGDLIHLHPFRSWITYKSRRGMSPWHDAVDWVGGYPFEVATPEEIFDFFHKRGFELVKMQTNKGTNRCNQFLFRKQLVSE